MRHHTRAFTTVAATVVIAAAATACSGSTDTGSSSSEATPAASASMPVEPAVASSSAATVTSANGPLGRILLNHKGHTLYVFDKDKTSTSTCTGACATAWPPLTVTGKPTADTDVDTKLLSTSTRSDGKKQVTYKGHPLYRFSGDTKANQTNGQGVNAFGAKWYVIGTDGKKITKSAPRQSQSPSDNY